jgi:TPR repeat protein
MLASNLYFVKGVKKRKMIMNYIQKVLTVFFVIGFISICVAHQSIAESNFQEIISKAEQGEADAQYHLGSMYCSGEGVPHDDEQAIQWYTKAAEQGDTMSQTNLGSMYKHGEGVPQDFKQAIQWYTKTAEQGDVDAQYNLALMYKNGEGVLQDYMIAYAWFNLAAFQGGELPRKNRDIILERMTPSQIEEGQKHSKELYDKIYNRDK